MKYPVFAIRDVKMGFGEPKLYLNEEVAKRDFKFKINQTDSILQYAPSDYEFYQIGYYETSNGVFSPLDLPVYLINGTDAIGD